jgi:hypothetical protein
MNGELKVAGFEMKASNAAPLSKRVQKEVFNMVCSGAHEGEVEAYVRPIAMQIKQNEIPIEDVTLRTRIGKNLPWQVEAYESELYDKNSKTSRERFLFLKNEIEDKYKVHGGGIKAAIHYSDNSKGPKFGKGDSVTWTYVQGIPNTIAYQDPSELEEYILDSDVILQKMLKAKLDSVYITLGWDIDGALGAPRPKAYGWW